MCLKLKKMITLNMAVIQDVINREEFNVLLLAAVSICIFHVLVKVFKRRMTSSRVEQKLAKRKQLAEHRKNIVRDQFTKNTVLENITSKPIESLVKDLKSGKLKCVDVLHAFQQKAFEENTRLNFITEPIVEAEAQAKELDSRDDKSGLLFGLPVSLKENINVKGYDSTAGMEIFIDEISKEDHVIVQLLKQHGAIPFVRTNLPQSMMSFDCSNPLYNATSNPQDTSRSPGGSSGGEGAILGSGASLMGIGNDIGGSLRIPAEFCGVYSLKPTSGRLSGKGMRSIEEGNTSIIPTDGPMARDFQSLLLLTQALFSPEMSKLDPSVPCLPFDLKEYEKTEPLQIGYFTFDGLTNCQPPNIRAVMEAKCSLEKLGHKLVPFEFPMVEGKGRMFPCGDVLSLLIFPERGETLSKLLKKDRLETALSPLKWARMFPAWVFRLINYLFGHKDKHLSITLQLCAGSRSIPEFFNHVSKAIKWQELFMKAWLDQNLDAVICPVFCAPPPTRDVSPHVVVAGSYTQLFNALNYPAGVMPVTKVTKEDVDQTFDPKVFKPETMIEKMLLKSSKNAQGLSVGVQVASLPFREEMCLRVMRDLATGLDR